MKITDEMIDKAYALIALEKQDIRDILEAALADVPDADELASRQYLQKLVVLQDQNLEAAEAKLAKVRAWNKGFPRPYISLDAILKETP